MSGGGSGYGQNVQQIYNQTPSNLGGSGQYAGQDVAQDPNAQQAPPSFGWQDALRDSRQAGRSGLGRGLDAAFRMVGYGSGQGPYAGQYGNMPGGFFGYGGPTQQPGGGYQSHSQTPWSSYAPSYGQLGSYNTLAQDLAQGRTGAFGFGGPGGPFQYAPGGDPSGRRGPSGYTGIGPFQNQGGGRVPSGFQTSMGLGGWPGFGIGGSPHQQPPYNYPGGGYGGAYGGGGYGQMGSPFFSGPGSYGQPGSMPYGGGSGMYQSGLFGRMQRQQDMAQRPWTPGQRRPGSPTGARVPFAPQFPYGMQPMMGGGGATTGQSSLPAHLQNPGSAGPRSVQPAQQVQQYLNYRSPYSGGGKYTQYGPQQGAMW